MKTSKQFALTLLIALGSILSSQAQDQPIRPHIGPIDNNCDNPILPQFSEFNVDSDCRINLSVKVNGINPNPSLYSFEWKIRNLTTNQLFTFGPFNGDDSFTGHVFDEDATYQICATVKTLANSLCVETICLNLTVSGCEPTNPPVCEEEVESIWCNDYNGPLSGQYPIIVNSSVKLCNPFNHSASGTYSWNPAYFSGIQLAGGTFGNLPAGGSAVMPSQFALNADGNANPNGFYIPFKIKYVDNVTGAIQYVYLNPLVAPCGDDGGSGNQNHISTISLTETSIFPNPYRMGETLQFVSNESINEVTVYNAFGNLVGTFNAVNNKISLQDNLVEGIYFVKYKVNNTGVTKKLIVKN
jgi:hypothetical protein